MSRICEIKILNEDTRTPARATIDLDTVILACPHLTQVGSEILMETVVRFQGFDGYIIVLMSYEDFRELGHIINKHIVDHGD